MWIHNLTEEKFSVPETNETMADCEARTDYEIIQNMKIKLSLSVPSLNNEKVSWQLISISLHYINNDVYSL